MDNNNYAASPTTPAGASLLEELKQADVAANAVHEQVRMLQEKLSPLLRPLPNRGDLMVGIGGVEQPVAAVIELVRGPRERNQETSRLLTEIMEALVV